MCLYCEVAYLVPESPVLVYLLLFVYMCVVYVPWLVCGDQRVTCVGSRPLLLSYGTWRSKIKFKIVMLVSKPLYPLNHLTGPHTYHFCVWVVRTRSVYSQQFKKDEFVVHACTCQSSVWLEDGLQELVFFHQVSSRDQTQIKAGQGEPSLPLLSSILALTQQFTCVIPDYSHNDTLLLLNLFLLRLCITWLRSTESILSSASGDHCLFLCMNLIILRSAYELDRVVSVLLISLNCRAKTFSVLELMDSTVPCASFSLPICPVSSPTFALMAHRFQTGNQITI